MMSGYAPTSGYDNDDGTSHLIPINGYVPHSTYSSTPLSPIIESSPRISHSSNGAAGFGHGIGAFHDDHDDDHHHHHHAVSTAISSPTIPSSPSSPSPHQGAFLGARGPHHRTTSSTSAQRTGGGGGGGSGPAAGVGANLFLDPPPKRSWGSGIVYVVTRLRSPRRMKAWFHAAASNGADSSPFVRTIVAAASIGFIVWLLMAMGAPPRTAAAATQRGKTPIYPKGAEPSRNLRGMLAKTFPFLGSDSSLFPFSSSSSSASSPPPGVIEFTIPTPEPYHVRLAQAQAMLDADPDSDGLAYRRFLERTTSPEGQMTHSPTMAFDHIYVLSLPHRMDRRAEMTRLANALGVKLTFVDAALKDEPFIQWIGERVAETRELRRRVMAKARKASPASIGGLHIGSDWLTPYLDKKHLKVFPQFPSDRKRYPTGNWITHLEALHTAGNHTSLKPIDEKFDLAKALNDPLEEFAVRQVHEGIISTYWGQTRALKAVVQNGDRAALIMEDDVDVEWDLERLWSRIHRKLPEDWDVTFLGHCWSREYISQSYGHSPMRLHPHIHASVMPMCLHGWAVSADGAQRLLSTFLDPWSAYSTAVDLVLPTMIRYHRIAAYSIQPPLIIQRKDGPSDLQEGSGSKWRGILRDSTVERLAKDDGTYEGMKPFDPANIDPGTKLRMGWCPSEFDDGKDGEGR
ncbi:BZ3501_MvSof-1269-A2-R1_Chr11g02779 [Microbotryum saponariae]|nr:BZ3501_MvSof-1269-A2-R1_Chr11g02779 [Microbotryum saponariae]